MLSASQAPVPPPEEVAEEIQRIVSSDRFKASDTIRKLLLFLAKRAAVNPGVPVKEYELAVEVLERDGDFDAREDSAVRALTSRLRSKLSEYYVHEGAGDAIIIDIPKGHYFLSSVYRPAALHSFGLALEAPSGKAQGRYLRFSLAAALGFVAAAIPAYFVGRVSALPSVPAACREFWDSFDGSPGDLLIVYSNPTFQYSSGGGMRLLHGPPAETPDVPAATPRLVDGYTGTGEAMAVSELMRQLLLVGKPAHVKRARLFTWDEVQAYDLIFVGSQDQNSPLGKLPKLEKFNFTENRDNSIPTAVVVRNEMPAPGEEHVYIPTGQLDEGVDYAIVALTQAVSPEHRVLILAGCGTYGTQAAAEFVCHPARLAELIKKLELRSGSKVPPFEALLEVQVRGGAPLEPRLLLVYRRR